MADMAEQFITEIENDQTPHWDRVVGLGADGVLYTGFDNDLIDTGWFPEDKRKLAEHMIARWKKYGGIE